MAEFEATSPEPLFDSKMLRSWERRLRCEAGWWFRDPDLGDQPFDEVHGHELAHAAEALTRDMALTTLGDRGSHCGDCYWCRRFRSEPDLPFDELNRDEPVRGTEGNRSFDDEVTAVLTRRKGRRSGVL